MRKIYFLLLLIPGIVCAQAKKSVVKQKSVVKTETVKNTEGFTINGTIKGYAEGTLVKLLNANTGEAESTATINKNKFTLSGKQAIPDFKLLQVNNEQRYITLFLDNSTVQLNAEKDSIPQAVITGSKSQNEFQEYNDALKPYEKMLNQQGNYDAAFMGQAAGILEKFINAHPNSYISPLAIYRYNQLTSNSEKMETLYTGLDANVKMSPIGNYLAQQIAENKKSLVGKPMPDFSQPDTAGNVVKLSSLKGQYVLVDFWASWCGPCRAENPNVVRMYNKYKNKKFTVLGVSLDKSKEPWIKAINADALTWTHVSDLQGWSNSVAQQFEVQSIPQNFLLDPEGNVIAKNLRGAALEYKLESLLK